MRSALSNQHGSPAPSNRGHRTGFPLRASLSVALRHTRAGVLPLLWAALLLQGLTLLLAIPAIAALFNQVLSHAGVHSLTDQNLHRVLGDPLALALLIALVGIALLAVSVQLTTIIVIANRQQSGQSLAIRRVITDVAGAARAVFHYQSPLLIVYVLVIMPIGGFGLFSAITRDIAVPLFISGEMMKTPVSALLYGAGIAVAAYLNVRLIFTFILLVIEKTTPTAAVAASLTATRGQSWRIAVAVGLISAGAAAASTVLAEAVLLAIRLADQLYPAASMLTATVGYGIVTVGSAVTVSFALVVIVQTLTAAYRFTIGQFLDINPNHGGAGEAGGSTTAAAGGDDGGHRVRRFAGSALAGAIVVSAVAVASVSVVPPAAGADLKVGGTAVIAHRGFVGGGVENTISALEAAAAVEPDYVEIDAQQTKDGGFILSHDINLWLVSGENVNTYELTLAEALSMTVSVGGFSDKMSSLTGYVQRAEELGVTLMIELKMHGHESADVVDLFLAELDAMGSTTEHIYHSLDNEVVKELKAKRPELTVGRTIAASIGDLADGPGDFLLVEQSFFQESFVEYAHKHDKKLLVWTVNDEDSMRDFLRIPVDGIVTDRPAALQRERAAILSEQGASPWLRDALDQFTLF